MLHRLACRLSATNESTLEAHQMVNLKRLTKSKATLLAMSEVLTKAQIARLIDGTLKHESVVFLCKEFLTTSEYKNKIVALSLVDGGELVWYLVRDQLTFNDGQWVGNRDILKMQEWVEKGCKNYNLLWLNN